MHAVHGRDGADTMLLAQMPPELVAKRFARLVVGSGDGIFAVSPSTSLPRRRVLGATAPLRLHVLALRATDVVLAA